MSTKRALHYVFRIGNRNAAINFFIDILGMKVLRHEEFDEQCKASCNGPYDGKWSKTMVGYGHEDDHFVCELTYNYGVSNYSQDPVQYVSLSSASLQKSIKYWKDLAEMSVYEETSDSVTLGFSENQAKLILQYIDTSVDHGNAGGRIAFSCPTEELPNIESQMKFAGEPVLTPLVKLDTPGKAQVQVVILADPDGHEICFVGDEGFRSLSQIDPVAEELLKDAIAEDKSDEWFSKRGGKSSS